MAFIVAIHKLLTPRMVEEYSLSLSLSPSAPGPPAQSSASNLHAHSVVPPDVADTPQMAVEKGPWPAGQSDGVHAVFLYGASLDKSSDVLSGRVLPSMLGAVLGAVLGAQLCHADWRSKAVYQNTKQLVNEAAAPAASLSTRKWPLTTPCPQPATRKLPLALHLWPRGNSNSSTSHTGYFGNPAKGVGSVRVPRSVAYMVRTPPLLRKFPLGFGPPV